MQARLGGKWSEYSRIIYFIFISVIAAIYSATLIQYAYGHFFSMVQEYSYNRAFYDSNAYGGLKSYVSSAFQTISLSVFTTTAFFVLAFFPVTAVYTVVRQSTGLHKRYKSDFKHSLFAYTVASLTAALISSVLWGQMSFLTGPAGLFLPFVFFIVAAVLACWMMALIQGVVYSALALLLKGAFALLAFSKRQK